MARCFVALGDSFTAATDPNVEGWPDELARRLPVGRFLNLARPGASSHDVVEEQLASAVRAGPDLISLVCGANDVIATTRPDLGAFAAALDELLATLRDGLPRATIVTATYPDVSAHSPLRPRSRRRIADGMRAVNAEIHAASARHGVLSVDLAAHPDQVDAESLRPDGFHASPAGQRKVGRLLLDALREHVGLALDPQEAMA